MIVYFLEHPTRGICVEIPGDRDDAFHFAWSKPRTEARTMSLRMARHLLEMAPRDTKIMRDDGPGLDVRFKEVS